MEQVQRNKNECEELNKMRNEYEGNDVNRKRDERLRKQ